MSDRATVYLSMPSEDMLRRQCAGGAIPDLKKLIEISARRARYWDVLKAALRLTLRGAFHAVPWRLVHSSVRQIASRHGARKAVRGRRLKISIFCELSYFRGVAQSVIEAAAQHEILLTDTMADVLAFNPDVVLSPQANPHDILGLRESLPNAFFVYLRHGVVTKVNALVVASYYDAVCVSSSYIAKEYVRNGGFAARTVWVTGNPQMDRIVSARVQRVPNAPLILYVPTHNPGLTSVGWLQPHHLVDFVERTPHVRLVVKLHPNLCGTKEWQGWRAGCSGKERIEFCDDPDLSLAAYLPLASVVISDFSSAPFLFLPFDRPIVLLTPPSTFDSPSFDRDGIEFRWRDLADEVTDLEKLDFALQRALVDPDARRERRRNYCELLFGDSLDGQCGKRILRKIEKLFS